MSITEIAEIPPDLAAEAAQVPGIGVRLISFLRAEIAQNQKRPGLHSHEAGELLRQAQAEAKKLKDTSGNSNMGHRHPACADRRNACSRCESMVSRSALKAAGVTREEAMEGFEKNYLEVLKQL